MDGRLIAGRYRLIEHLGTGGMGTVWRARDETLNLDVAVKEVRVDGDEAVKRALAEARNAAALRNHPNIVAVHDAVLDGGVPWMVMRLVDGRSLAEELEARGALHPGEVGRIAAGVLSALGAAHAAGIIHRDVKPANVLLARDSTVLLADFGIAKNHADTKLTATGSFIGTLEYLAPERFDGTPDTPAVDLWCALAAAKPQGEGTSDQDDATSRAFDAASQQAVTNTQDANLKEALSITAAEYGLQSTDDLSASVDNPVPSAHWPHLDNSAWEADCTRLGYVKS